MRRWGVLAAIAILVGWCGGAAAQQLVHFGSLDDNGAGQAVTTLDAYLYRPAGEGRHPAVVFLHGCGGLISRSTGLPGKRELAWAAELNRSGYVVLMVDSFTPRGVTQMCAPATYNQAVAMKRPHDAYAALYYLQSQPFVRGDRIAAMGWSQGGGTVLWTVPTQSLGRPAALPQGDFRAAVAFYPASCSNQRQIAGWTTTIPLLVMIGAEDVWTPLGPCKIFIDGAIGRGAPIQMQIYPGAYHDFDWPDLPRREMPQFRTSAGVVPIEATDPAARADALVRVPAFFAQHLGN
jgi:dienelactone hydrolase